MGEPQLTECPRRTEGIVAHVRLDVRDRARRLSRAQQRHAEIPIRKIGGQRNGLLEPGDRLFMLALERQNPCELSMRDGQVGAKLNGSSSQVMRTFECRRL